MKRQINIHSRVDLNEYFYSSAVQECMSRIKRFLGDTHQVHLFPEAMMKINKMPNGILIKSKSQDSILMPFVLRDPGCGFLVFQINQVKKKEIPKLGKALLDFCLSLEKAPFSELEYLYLIEGIKQGVSHLTLNNDRFLNKVFPLDLDKLYIDLPIEDLVEDIKQITNTLELRLMHHSWADSGEDVDLVAWIHTGSECFPKIIFDRWFFDVADYSFCNKLASEDGINQGFCGLKNGCGQAEEYKQWIFASMNFCLYKRWWLYNQLEKFFNETFNLEPKIINDRCHAGLFKVHEKGSEYDLQTRGVQLLENHQNEPCLIAGQKESIAYLFMDILEPFVGHGTSYSFDESIDYRQALPNYLHTNIDHLIINVPFDPQKSLAYNYNIYHQCSYVNSKQEPIILYPLLNYHGNYLRKVLP
jgi:hypothetical protein